MSDFRTARAKLVMQRYAFYTGLAPNDPSALRDLVIDLGHYCDRHGLAVQDILKEALAIDHLERSFAPRDAVFPEVIIAVHESKPT